LRQQIYSNFEPQKIFFKNFILTEKKYNVLFLCSWYPNRIIPQLGNFVQKHAECVALYANVAALHVRSDAKINTTYDVIQETRNNVFTVNIYYKKNNFLPIISKIIKAQRYLKANYIGYKIICKHFGKPNLVHLNVINPAGIFALILKKTQNIPYIISENSTHFLDSNSNKYKKNIYHLFTKICVINAARVCPVSQDLTNAMQRKGMTGNYEIVPNVVDTHLFNISAEKQNEKFQFIHISTLKEDHKNVSGIIRTVAKLAEINADFELHIIHENENAIEAKAFAKELNMLDKKIFFEGPKSTSEVAEMLSKSDCLLLFSNYENLPCVIVEAMACGVPVISTDVGGIAEHLNKLNGIILKPRDESALLNSMLDMINDSKRFSSEKIREYAVTNFSYEAVGRKFLEIYQQIKPL